MNNAWIKRIEELEAEVAKLKGERDADRRREYGYYQRLMDEIRNLEWKIYRPLKEGEMTQEGDQVLGPEEDAKWVPVTGNHRLTPSALYPAHCHYRRLIVDEIKKEMEGDYFYRKCVAGKESARSERIKKLEAEVAKLTTALKDKPDQSDLDAAVFRINHLEAENKRLEEELESHAWEISPAMAQAKIDHLNKRVGELGAALTEERQPEGMKMIAKAALAGEVEG